LGLDCLFIKLNLADIMFVFDILNEHVFCPELLAIIGFQISPLDTRNLDLFVIPHYRTNSEANSFLSRAIQLAEKYPFHLIFLILHVIILKLILLSKKTILV